MDKWIGAVVAVVIVGVAAWLMLRSWKRRTVRDETMSAFPPPAQHGDPIVETEVLYIATTPVGRPLERLAVQGLAFRGAAHLEVLPEGVVIRIAGEPANFVPADRIVAAGAATYVIDRGVEPEGLIAITWIVQVHDPELVAPHVDSYFRARYPGDSARIIAAVGDIAAAPMAPRPEQESEASDD
ncbi:PH-like domain-containing protein [Agromyces bauzanensis]